MFETVGLVLVFGALTLGAYIALVKFWNHQLEDLQNARIPYRGESLWRP